MLAREGVNQAVARCVSKWQARIRLKIRVGGRVAVLLW